jgi:hypothetical protein
MTELEAIFKRHAVRNYKDKRIEQDTIDKIKAKIDELNEKGDLHLQFIEDAGNTFNRLLNKAMGLGSAPSVIACVGKKADDLDQRIGYFGEQLVLYAQTLGLNTCWAGTFNKKNLGAAVGDDEKVVIAIAIGYGEHQGNERKSKTADQVSEVAGERPEWFDNGVEMALLAPTAMNQQKFLIRLTEDGKVEFINKGGFYSEVDLGIVKYHFEVGAGRLE